MPIVPRCRLHLPPLVTLLCSLLGLLLVAADPAAPAHAATIAVTTTGDDTTVNGNCTLREAVRAANTNAPVDGCAGDAAGADTITLPAGTYTLALGGRDENAAATGDLDVTSPITIVGAGATATVVDGGGIDRVFHVSAAGSLTASDLTVLGGNTTGGVGPAEGGGIYVDGGTLALTRVIVRQNTASAGSLGGGGLATNGGTVTLIDSAVRDNAASQGGGVRLAGATLTATGTTFSANKATGPGAGFLLTTGATARLTNSTVSGNTTDGSGGGFILGGAGPTLVLASSTVAGNTATAGTGGGIFLAAGTATLRNTILAGNRGGAAPDCANNPVTSAGYNILGDNSGCAFSATTGDQVGTGASPIVPLLGALVFNGGATETRALTTGSPALDAGNPAGCTSADAVPILLATDQRGLARPQGTRCDVGAYEALQLTIGDVAQNEGNAGSTSVDFAVSLSAAVPAGFPAVTVDYSTAAGGASPATAGSDYTAVGATTLTFNAGESSKNAAVAVAGDTTPEADETFLVNLANAAGAAIVDAQALGTILNDDASPPAVTTSSGSLSYTENQGAVAIDPGLTIVDVDSTTLTGASVALNPRLAEDGLVFVDQNGITGTIVPSPSFVVLTLSGNASVAAYQAALRSVAYANTSETPNPFPRTVSFQVTDDTATASTPADRQITFTVVNDPPVNTVPGAQTTPGNTPLVFSGGNAISIADPDAGGADVQIVLTVPAGQGTLAPGAAGTVPPLTTVTGSGTNSLTLVGSLAEVNAALAGLTYTPPNGFSGSVTLTVTTGDLGNTGGPAQQDQDAVQINVGALPTVSVNDPAAVAEGDSGTPNGITFTVTLSAASNLQVQVSYTIANGTATGGAVCGAGIDFQNAGGTVTFALNDTSETIVVPVCGDTSVEGNETLLVTLGTPTGGATIADGQGVGTIADDDLAGGVSFSAGTVSVPENAGQAVITVQRSGGTGPAATQATGTTPAGNVPSGSVRPNPPTSPAGPSTGTVSPSALAPITVSFATANGTALAGQDYAAVAGTLTFGVGETTKTIVIPILADNLVEGAETFTVTLSGPTGGATLGQQATVTVVIVDTTHASAPPSPGDDSADVEREERERETEEERRQRARTNRGNKDDDSTEGDVLETHCDAAWPSVVIANHDGAVEVKLLKEAQKVCSSISVGDYLEADGEKQHEGLFHADSVEIKRRR